MENTDYAAFAARVIRGHARRIADGDIDGVADLLGLSPRSWTPPPSKRSTAYAGSGTPGAARLGTARQAAQQRWGT